MEIDGSIQHYNCGRHIDGLDGVVKRHIKLGVPLPARDFFAMSPMRLTVIGGTRPLSMHVVRLARFVLRLKPVTRSNRRGQQAG